MTGKRASVLLLAFGTCLGLWTIGCGDARGAGIEVSRAAIGEQWPFDGIERGTVECEGTAATFVSAGRRYALNGFSKSRFGHPFPHEADIMRKVPLSKDNPSLGTVNADTEILRKFCDK